MVQTIKMGLILMLITLVAGVCLSWVYSVTAPRIAEAERKAMVDALREVLVDEEGRSLEPLSYTPTPVPVGDGQVPSWRAERGGKLMAVAFQTEQAGYQSRLKIMVGLDPQGSILGLKIVSQAETPGLGARTAEIASKDYIWQIFQRKEPTETELIRPWFEEQFKGVSATKRIGIDKVSGEWATLDRAKRQELRGRNYVTAITGATVSTTAVIKAINQVAAQVLETVRLQMMEPPEAATVSEEVEESA